MISALSDALYLPPSVTNLVGFIHETPEIEANRGSNQGDHQLQYKSEDEGVRNQHSGRKFLLALEGNNGKRIRSLAYLVIKEIVLNGIVYIRQVIFVESHNGNGNLVVHQLVFPVTCE